MRFRIRPILLGLVAPTLFAADPKTPEPGTKLETRIVPAYRYIHPEGNTPLPPMRDGEARFDALPFFQRHGLNPPPGARAIWLPKGDEIVLTLSAKDHERAVSILDPGLVCPPVVSSIAVTLALWEYEDDAAGPGEPPPTFRVLQEKAGKTLRLLHAHTITTRSGNRMTGFSRFAPDQAEPTPPKNTATTPPKDASEERTSLGNAHGSSIEVEPVIGPDGVTFDAAMGYEFRIPSNLAGRDIELHGATNLSFADGQNLVAHTALLPRPANPGAAALKPLRYALVIGGRLNYEATALAEELQKGMDERKRERDLKMIQRAIEGLENSAEPK